MNGDGSEYQFPATLNEQKRFIGLPPEEAFLLLAFGLIGFYIDMLIVMICAGGVAWLFLRHLKKGQGSWWLMNLLYWYLPTVLFRVQFRRVPDSANRHWMQ